MDYFNVLGSVSLTSFTKGNYFLKIMNKINKEADIQTLFLIP